MFPQELGNSDIVKHWGESRKPFFLNELE